VSGAPKARIFELCVWASFYDVHVNRVERCIGSLLELYCMVLRVLRGTLLHIGALFTVTCIMFVFDIQGEE
jgi:hypothetical protein